LRLLLFGDEVFRDHAIYPARQNSPVLSLLLWKIPFFALPFGLLLPLTGVGLWVGWRRARFLAALVLGLSVMVLMFFVTARYRIVLVPFLLIFAAQAVHWFVAEADGRRRLIAGTCAAGLFLLANLGQGPMDSHMNPDAEDSLASQLGAEGHVQQARLLFESVVAHRPDYVEAWLNLGVCYDKEGRVREAKYALARAFQVDRKAAMGMLRKFATEGSPEEAGRIMSLLREMTGTAGDGKTPAAVQTRE
jgi:tetratricopeptide (TPR) repeat protein